MKSQTIIFGNIQDKSNIPRDVDQPKNDKAVTYYYDDFLAEF